MNIRITFMNSSDPPRQFRLDPTDFKENLTCFKVVPVEVPAEDSDMCAIEIDFALVNDWHHSKLHHTSCKRQRQVLLVESSIKCEVIRHFQEPQYPHQPDNPFSAVFELLTSAQESERRGNFNFASRDFESAISLLEHIQTQTKDSRYRNIAYDQAAFFREKVALLKTESTSTLGLVLHSLPSEQNHQPCLSRSSLECLPYSETRNEMLGVEKNDCQLKALTDESILRSRLSALRGEPTTGPSTQVLPFQIRP